ncbi:hypothetical protein [Streptomyces hilarionis]|uniref:hypothetical protein n=1 Tax=Streptomyces hilarionis TaxID=2839954 RepID=UPI00211A0AC3|nr:hypothetical protein [Streptomyces hilarionis]
MTTSARPLEEPAAEARSGAPGVAAPPWRPVPGTPSGPLPYADSEARGEAAPGPSSCMSENAPAATVHRTATEARAATRLRRAHGRPAGAAAGGPASAADSTAAGAAWPARAAGPDAAAGATGRERRPDGGCAPTAGPPARSAPPGRPPGGRSATVRSTGRRYSVS